MGPEYAFDWAELAFASKKPIRELKATFIMAPRQLSQKRFTQLVREYLPKGHIILGLAKEDYIDGFEGQPQFKTLQPKDVQPVIDKVNTSASPYKIHALSYHQRELPYILEKINFREVLGVRGSWLYVFHATKAYFLLAESRTPYALVSPFTDEAEARSYAKTMQPQLNFALPNKLLASEEDALRMASEAAKASYDTSYQTGVLLAKKTAKGYQPLLAAHNKVVPYETYAWHHGVSREINFSPANDLNHYDTIHAEMNLLVNAQRAGIDLKGTTFFINLMPCPTCARTLSQTDIDTFIYSVDHSDGYAVKLFEDCSKNVKRVVY